MKKTVWEKQAEAAVRKAMRGSIGKTMKGARAAGRRMGRTLSRALRSGGGKAAKAAASSGRRPGIIRKSGARIKGSGALRNALAYACKADKGRDGEPHVICQNLVGQNLKAWLEELQLEYLRAPGVQEILVHDILAWHPSRVPTDAEMAQAIQLQLQKCGFAGCAFIAIRHYDQPHAHAHIYVSRVRPDGELVALSQNWKRWTAALREVERELDLPEPPPGAKPVQRDRAVNAQRRAERRGTVPNFIDPNAVRQALARSRTTEELRQFLDLQQIELVTSKAADGRVRGLLLRRKGAAEWLAGVSVARDLSLPKVEAVLAANRQRDPTSVPRWPLPPPQQHELRQRPATERPRGE